MIEPDIPANEADRQAALERYAVLDSEQDGHFDAITQLMAQISGAPICLIAMLDRDRNWMKSQYGIDVRESPRAISFCGHAINTDAPIMVVADAREDERFHDNPLVTELHAVFYAGVPLMTPDGFRVGTICLYDHEPRRLSEPVRNALIAMAHQVEALLELRYRNRLLRETKAQLQQRNDELTQFALTVSHDLKTPLSKIAAIGELLKLRLGEAGDPEARSWLQKLHAATIGAAKYVDELLSLYTSDILAPQAFELTTLDQVMQEVQNVAMPDMDARLSYSADVSELYVNRGTLMHILVNLVSNAIRYNDKPQATVQISCRDDDHAYDFEVADNGRGIPAADLQNIFGLFQTGQASDRDGAAGTGVGLYSIKTLIERAGGTISVQSREGAGTTFRFSLPKRLPEVELPA